MGYRELIKKIQVASGFSDAESEEALNCMVEGIAERLTMDEREHFASQLPAELKEVAMTVVPFDNGDRQDIIEEFMEKEEIDEARAKKQVLSAWEAIKAFVSDGQIRHIRAQLPTRAAELLH